MNGVGRPPERLDALSLFSAPGKALGGSCTVEGKSTRAAFAENRRHRRLYLVIVSEPVQQKSSLHHLLWGRFCVSLLLLGTKSGFQR